MTNIWPHVMKTLSRVISAPITKGAGYIIHAMTLRSRRKTARILAVTLVLSAGSWAHATDALLPKPERLVSDTAAVLLPDEVDQLEARLERLRASGLAEAIIYLAPSLPEGAVMEDLTLQSANAWGIGDAATNNGLAIFAFMKDRKLRIEVGLGLESRISDAAAAAIIKEQIAPSFRETKYAEGLNAAIDRIEAILRQEQASSEITVEYVKTSLGTSRRIVGVMNAPPVTRRVNPHYPEEARRAGIQGPVELEVLIDTSGKVKKVTVTKGLSHGLTEAAVAAVRQWVFEPVTVDAAAVPAVIDVVVNFKL